MHFSELIGQHSVQASLRQMVQGERMPHALLFLGQEGCGKLALAWAFAQFVMCENRGEEDSCGSCSSCIKAAKIVHPDLHFSYPTIGTNVRSEQYLPQWRTALAENPYMNVNQWLQSIGAENKQGNINKEECANIIRKLSLKTFEANYKVMIIWLPEYLGKEGNRLLKLIEEPPENTLFILVAEEQEKILNTILSRCQVVKIKPLIDEELMAGLMKNQAITHEQAQTVAHLANGNYNEAQSLIEHNENDNAQLFLDWMRKCYVGNGVDMYQWVEVFAKLGRENQKYFLRYALHFMREYLVLKLTGQANVRLQAQELKTAQNLTKVIELQQIDKITQLLTDYTYYVERNANPKILFLDASIQMNKILKNRA